mgnify:CR=1 FL=1
MFYRFIALCFVTLAFACAPASDGPVSADPNQALKDAVRNGDKNDSLVDMCEEYGWYNDAFCDYFCDEPDPACGKCENMETLCRLSEIPTDTDGDGCPDTCIPEEEPELPPEPAALPLGSDCDENDQCSDDAYCARPLGVCNDAPGVCTVKPNECADANSFVPHIVCGCDGFTYGHPCDAESFGANLLHDGMCEDLADGSNW